MTSIHNFEGAQELVQNFGVTQLLENISKITSASGQILHANEINALAALLIQQLSQNLNHEIVTNFADNLRFGNDITDLPRINLEVPPLNTTLPEDFPDSAAMPSFLYGDRLQWRPLSEEDETDTGVAIGRFYAYASNRHQWTWKYLILLDKESHSAQFCLADTAWEHHLEPVTLTQSEVQ
ncbi:hypothetical protein NIES2101_09355 [Calothrix sp. HK-06]|nr:hypothetical protein NIES2101_09355 [Calothrix sp. HK-06]